MSSGKDAPSYANIVAPERPTTQKQSSWLEECLHSEETSPKSVTAPATVPDVSTTVPVVAEKKRSASSTNEPNDPTDNSSEVDDNGDFVPVLSHSRKERKIRRKEKQQQTSAGPKSGRKGATGSSGEGTPVSTGEQSKKSSRRQRGDRKTPRKEKEPLVNGKDSNTDNGNESSGNASETKTDEQTDKPVKYVAAPPPKVNAWKVSVSITIFLSVFSVCGFINGFAVVIAIRLCNYILIG